MPVRAVVHQATRVVFAVSTRDDPLPPPLAYADCRQDLDVANGPWKLSADGNALSKPTEAEIDAARWDSDGSRARARAAQRRQRTLDALNTAATDTSVPPSVRAAFARLREELSDGA